MLKILILEIKKSNMLKAKVKMDKNKNMNDLMTMIEIKDFSVFLSNLVQVLPMMGR